MASKKNWLQIRAEHSVAAALIAVLRRAPLPVAKRCARTAARTLDALFPKLRRVARTNLSFSYPELEPAQRELIIDGVFENIARLLVSIARFPDLNSSNICEWISCEGLEHYANAKRGGRGVLVATAHLGNWELSAFAHALMTEPMRIMVRPLDNPLIDDLIESRRTLSGNGLIYKRDAARAVIKALKSNEAVGILIDQNTTPAEGVFVNFFGQPACAGSAFVKLAYHTGAPVIPGFAVWKHSEQRYVLRFYPQIQLSGHEAEDTQRIHAVIEQVIRQYPDQWMWIHRRWKARPPGYPPLY